MSSRDYNNITISSKLQQMESSIENRKSQVLLAAQLIDSEVQNVNHLKRQSLGSIDSSIDPEMEYTVNQSSLASERPQLYTRKTHNGVFVLSKSFDKSDSKKRGRLSLTASQSDENFGNNSTVAPTSKSSAGIANSDSRGKSPTSNSDFSKHLLWVSADKHPSVKPKNYLQLVQNTLHQMNGSIDGDNQDGDDNNSNSNNNNNNSNNSNDNDENAKFKEEAEAIIRDIRRLSTLAKRPSRLRRSYIEFSEREEEENEREEAVVAEKRLPLLKDDRDDWKRRSLNNDIFINSYHLPVNEINITLKDLSDEITKISSKAGLTQDDAVTLATTLSMAGSLSFKGNITRPAIDSNDLEGIDEKYASALVDNDARHKAKTSLLRGKCNKYKRKNSASQKYGSPSEVCITTSNFGESSLKQIQIQQQQPLPLQQDDNTSAVEVETKEDHPREEASLSSSVPDDLGSSHYSSDGNDDTFSVHRAPIDDHHAGSNGFTSEESFDQGSLTFTSDEFNKGNLGNSDTLGVEPKLLPSPLIVKTESLPSNITKETHKESHREERRTKKTWFWTTTKSNGDENSETHKKQTKFESRVVSLFRKREKHSEKNNQAEDKNDSTATSSSLSVPNTPKASVGATSPSLADTNRPVNRFSIFNRTAFTRSNESSPTGNDTSFKLSDSNDITGGFILSSLKKVRSLSIDNGRPHSVRSARRSGSIASLGLSDAEQSNDTTSQCDRDNYNHSHHHQKTKSRTTTKGFLEKISLQNDSTNIKQKKKKEKEKKREKKKEDKPVVKCRARKPYYRQTLLPLQQQRQRQLQLELQFQQRRQRELLLIQQKQQEQQEQKQKQKQKQEQKQEQRPSAQEPQVVSTESSSDQKGNIHNEPLTVSNKAKPDQNSVQQPVLLPSNKTTKRGTTNNNQSSAKQETNDTRETYLPPRKPTFDDIVRPERPNGPQQLRASAFGFPLPAMTPAVVIMFDHRLPITAERAIYRLSHMKLGNPKRPLREQVLLSNFMYAYLNLVDHTLYMEQAAATTAATTATTTDTATTTVEDSLQHTAEGSSLPVTMTVAVAAGPVPQTCPT